MSTQAALPKEPPVKMYGIAGRYANAIYSAAAKTDSLPAVEADLKLFSQTINESAAIKAFCVDPGVSRPAKAKGVADMLKLAGACDTTQKAMATLAEGGRMNEILKVTNLFEQIMMAAKGEVRATITLAKAVSDAEMKSIEASLSDVVVRAEDSSRRKSRCARPRPCS